MMKKKKKDSIFCPTYEEAQTTAENVGQILNLYFEYEEKPQWAGVTDIVGRRFETAEAILKLMDDNSLGNLIVRASKQLNRRHQKLIESINFVSKVTK
jgi:hypothetical protein